jgi:hypothetical protein
MYYNSGMKVIQKMGAVETGKNDRPSGCLKIIRAGERQMIAHDDEGGGGHT